MKRLLCLVAVLLFSVTARTAMAAVLLQPGTLADYIALGSAGGQIDDKLFFDFTYSSVGVGGPVAIPASRIQVTPISEPFNPGLRFSAAWTVGPGQLSDSLISFKVLVLPGGAPITDISARMDDFGTTGNGSVVVNETVIGKGDILLFDDAGAIQAFDETTFAPTIGPISVTKDIFVIGGQGTAGVSSVTNQFSEVIPEPSTLIIWSLLGSLAVAFGWCRRRR